MHEFTEERHGEGGFSVNRAGDHALAAERIANRIDRLNLASARRTAISPER
jgi:hypothetical protein